MLKFVAGFAVGFLTYGCIMTQVIKNEDSWNGFVKNINNIMGYDKPEKPFPYSDLSDSMRAEVDEFLRELEQKA